MIPKGAAGQAAPTAKNQQPQRIYVLESEDAIGKIRGITRCAFNAPVVLLVCGDKEAAWTNPFNDRNSAEMDCSIVTTQMMLQAQELGLGTCWIHRAKEEFETEEGKQILRDLGITEEYEGIGHLALGWPNCPHPKARPRKENYVYFAE